MPRRHRSFVLTLLAASIAALAMARPDAEARQAPEPRVVDITARRFAFEPAVVEVTEGEAVRLRIVSADGPHGFQIKPLKIRKEVPRGGEAVVIDFTPTTAGRFPILCSEYCGDGHGDMKGTLVVAARAAATP